MLTALLFSNLFRYVLKWRYYWTTKGRYLANNTYCANFVVAILVLAVIEGVAERIYADSDVDSAMSVPIVASAVWCSP